MATPVSNFRLSPVNVDDLDELAEALDTNRTEALNIAVAIARDRLGLQRRDAALAIDALTRIHGDDAELVAEIAEVNGDRYRVAVTIDGGDGEELEEWSGGVTVIAGDGATSGALFVRHDPSGSLFSLGVISPPALTAGFSVRLADLPKLLVAPDPHQDGDALRREIRASLQMRQKMHLAFDDEEES